jgi:hypothetical protein
VLRSVREDPGEGMLWVGVGVWVSYGEVVPGLGFCPRVADSDVRAYKPRVGANFELWTHTGRELVYLAGFPLQFGLSPACVNVS